MRIGRCFIFGGRDCRGEGFGGLGMWIGIVEIEIEINWVKI